jgi:hypothetical protein
MTIVEHIDVRLTIAPIVSRIVYRTRLSSPQSFLRLLLALHEQTTNGREVAPFMTLTAAVCRTIDQFNAHHAVLEALWKAIIRAFNFQNVTLNVGARHILRSLVDQASAFLTAPMKLATDIALIQLIGLDQQSVDAPLIFTSLEKAVRTSVRFGRECTPFAQSIMSPTLDICTLVTIIVQSFMLPGHSSWPF